MICRFNRENRLRTSFIRFGEINSNWTKEQATFIQPKSQLKEEQIEEVKIEEDYNEDLLADIGMVNESGLSQERETDIKNTNQRTRKPISFKKRVKVHVLKEHVYKNYLEKIEEEKEQFIEFEKLYEGMRKDFEETKNTKKESFFLTLLFLANEHGFDMKNVGNKVLIGRN